MSGNVEPPKRQESFAKYMQALGIAILVALVLRTFVVQAFRIPTGSMKDTLLVGDFLLVNKFIYGVRTPDRLFGTDVKIPHIRLPAFRSPKHGDIVIFKFPNDLSMDYIKRCVGLPGDTIQVKSNIVYVNGRAEGRAEFLQEKYDPTEQASFQYYRIHTDGHLQYTIRKRTKKPTRVQNYGPVVVPPDHLFMMGDNRDNSSDSRFWGFMPMDNLVGRAVVIYFSFDKFKDRAAWDFASAIRWSRMFNIIR